MTAQSEPPLTLWPIAKRQLWILLIIVAAFLAVIFTLYFQDRSQEWRLHQEQATHRINLAYEVISKELDRIRSDALFLAELEDIRQYAAGDRSIQKQLESAFSSFIDQKRSYDQIRLLDLTGQEMIRVDIADDRVRVIAPEELQDKSSRYYIRESLDLVCGEIFVSEFDLNQERGNIELPINPVIRFVTPVCDRHSTRRGLLVLNYLGARLLNELSELSIPGNTLLVRHDGHYLLSPDPDHEWGWLLDHDQTFSSHFPGAWDRVLAADGNGVLTEAGIFASRKLPFETLAGPANRSNTKTSDRSELLIVSHLPSDQVFAVSNQLLKRLLFLGGILLIPLFFATRLWSISLVRRQQQNRRIQASELRLRELSSRMLKIQEAERRSISREIHDELGQQATAINLDLKMAARDWDPNQPQQHLKRAIQENEQLLHSLHDFAKRVRPSTLDDLGLKDAVESYVSEFRSRTGMDASLHLSLGGATLPPNVSENAFRLVQEMLTNVAKHADAGQVEIRMQVEDQSPQPVFELEVTDDGIGNIESEMDGSRLGILGMRERVDLLRGTINIDSRANRGTSVKIRIPLFASPSSQDNV